MCRMIVLAAAKKGPKTTPIVLSLQTIESRKSALILKIILLSIVIFFKCRTSQKTKFFVTQIYLQNYGFRMKF